MVIDPVTIEPSAPVYRAVELMRQNGISGIPVTQSKRLLGIITSRDVRFERNLNQRVEQIMTRKLITAREGISQAEATELLHKNRIEKLLVVNDDFELKGLITIKDIEKNRAHPDAAKDSKGRLLCAAAGGIGGDWEARIEALLRAGGHLIGSDTAPGPLKRGVGAVQDTPADYSAASPVAAHEAAAQGT